MMESVQGGSTLQRARMMQGLHQSMGNARVSRLMGTAAKSRFSVGALDDDHEREADQATRSVMRMPIGIEHDQTVNRPLCPECQRMVQPQAQRKPPGATTAAEPLGVWRCPNCGRMLQRNSASEDVATTDGTAQTPSVTPTMESYLKATHGGGQSLPNGIRASMEASFGRDFSNVRVHDDSAASLASRDISARAFTYGQDIYFGAGHYQPNTPRGQELLAHELTHVVQQTGVNGGLVHTASQKRIARATLDLARLDQELRTGGPLTQTHGEIGSATAAGRLHDPPEPDSSVASVEAYIYKRTQPSAPPAAAPGTTSADTPASPTSPDAGASVPTSEIRDAGESLPGGVGHTTPAPTPSPTTTQASPPTERALVVGGVHGDELGPQAIMARLQAQLGSPTTPLRRDFDTIVIPVMNPGGVADRTRTNRRGVDLNRNFPGLTGFPAPAGRVAPEQLETAAVRRLIETLQPSRILALHAIGNRSQGGVYADPVEGEARELACRMALRMQGSPTSGGGTSGEINVRGNRLARGVCEARYPGAPPSVTSAQSSLGAWASAPTAIGGRGTTVITHEVSEKQTLPEHGAGRSVDTIMPGIEEFLRERGGSASEADALLRRAVTDTFLQGQTETAADRQLRSTIEGIVMRRFNDMATYYQTVWRPSRPAEEQRRLPSRLTSHSHVRTFDEQAGIVAGQLRSRGTNSTKADIKIAIQDILQTRSMPGFSRHHWGTEIDVLSADRAKWQGSPRRGAFVDVIPFLRTEARNFGFFHPYAGGWPRPSDPHYQEEPWHLSYWPIANVLQQEWMARFAGDALRDLIAKTARAIATRLGIPQTTMESALREIGLQHYQTNVTPSP